VPAPAASPESLTCPQCSASVPATFKFCGSCGFKMENVKQAASPAAAPAAPAAAPAAQPDETPSRGSLVLIRPDGSEGDTFPLSDGSTTLGRETSPMFQGDTFLSPTHATFAFEGSSLTVTDEDSLNGVYLRVNRDEPVELPDGAIFRIGQEILRFERLTAPNDPPGEEYMGSPDPGFLGRIRLVVGPDSYGNAYCIPPAGMHLGRERGDVIFPEDGYVSGLHCRLDSQGGKVFLTDVGSSNGTFIRVRGQAPVPSGTLLLMGQQLFRVEY
jgi:pSer/pThr/pTyr-binding forkhead associated (FHA) protein